MIGRDPKFQRTWRFPAILLAGLVFVPTLSAAQNINDCAAATNHLSEVADQANYCEQAQDCGSVRLREGHSVGCGLLINKAEQSVVESAIETYERYCTPYWHCRALVLHGIECTQNKCNPSPASNPSLEKLEK